MSSRCTNSRSVHRRTCRHEANNAAQERSPSGCAPRMGRRPRAVCFMSGSTLLRLKPEPAARLTSIIGRMMRAHRARIAQDTWRRGMLHGFAQYHDPRVLTMLVDGEFWGGEGRIGGERSVRPCPFYLLQEAIGNPSLQNGGRLVGLILGVIAEHMRQHLGIEDAARR